MTKTAFDKTMAGLQEAVDISRGLGSGSDYRVYRVKDGVAMPVAIPQAREGWGGGREGWGGGGTGKRGVE